MFILIVLLFVMNIILLDFISFFFPMVTNNTEFYSLLFIFIHGTFVLILLILKGDEYKRIFIAAFILRLTIMFVDIYHIFPVLHSGSDTEAFNSIALYNQNHIEQQSLTNYTTFLTFLYSVLHCSRILAQYINLLFGIGILFILKKTFELYSLNSKVILISLCLISFMPNFMIFSGILLREAWVEFFVTLSVYTFLYWYKTGNNLVSLYAIMSVLMAAYMHDGTIVLICGYTIAFLTYNPQNEVVQISRQSIMGLIVLTIISIFFISNSSLFTGKLGTVDSAEVLTSAINYRSNAGSSYLTWLHSDSVLLSFVFSPLKMFYFMYSPLPTDWRGLGDIIAFVIDSSVYIFISWNIYKSFDSNCSFSLIRNFLLIGLGVSIFVFAFGTHTAGTAMRHRAKLFPVMVTLYAFSTNVKYEDNKCYKIAIN